MTGEVNEPAVVAVVGGGTMGAGIAEVLLAAGGRVVVVESDAARVDAVRSRLEAQLEHAGETSRLGNDRDPLRRLEVSDAMAALGEAALVIEAVPEDLGLKLRVLAEIEAQVSGAAVIASNTSSMSIARLGDGLRRPQRFVGMHFFNPVPRSELVELIRGPDTADSAVDEARAWAERLGKQVIVVRDSPGFASSRLGIALGMEAIRMVEQGVASPEDIDTAMVLGYRHPMGPLRLTDLVGLDVRLAIAEHLAASLGDSFAPPRLLREMVAAGKLGKKSGEGFYRWPAQPDRDPAPSG